jgi:hypothetical protein
MLLPEPREGLKCGMEREFKVKCYLGFSSQGAERLVLEGAKAKLKGSVTLGSRRGKMLHIYFGVLLCI